MSSVHAVIMAGGAGTRFWPASRQTRPKQLLPLAHGESLIAATVQRVSGICGEGNRWIVTNPRQKRAIGSLLLDFPADHILVEPEPRDTAPCVAFATATIAAQDPEATLILLPADHLIEPNAEFERMLKRAIDVASDGETLVTFGVPPTFPATGYGYVEIGDETNGEAPRVHHAKAFREKPDRATAEEFVNSGRFWWNSGIFVFKVKAMQKAMAKHAPELGESCSRMMTAIANDKREDLTQAFQAAPKTSIDFAIMEKAERMAVVECTASWDDVGSFPALARVLKPDDSDNHLALHDGADASVLESRNNVVYAEGARTVALLGVEGLVVCAVGDAVLVCPKDRADDLKKMVAHLKETGRTDLL
ncbi:MAG: mannose-1-phosphate guanylyltransferase [Planctomycetota bacterium]